MHHSGDTTRRRSSGTAASLFSCALLLVLIIAVFWPLLTFGFLGWDDVQAIAQNRFLTPPTLETLGRVWSDFTLWFYVPVTYTVWWLLALFAYTPASDHAAGSMAAMPFHAANLLAHAANAVLLLHLLHRRMGTGRVAAWFGAAVFAVHPIQVEAEPKEFPH